MWKCWVSTPLYLILVQEEPLRVKMLSWESHCVLSHFWSLAITPADLPSTFCPKKAAGRVREISGLQVRRPNCSPALLLLNFQWPWESWSLLKFSNLDKLRLSPAVNSSNSGQVCFAGFIFKRGNWSVPLYLLSRLVPRWLMRSNDRLPQSGSSH